jgi:hypothetical protein
LHAKIAHYLGEPCFQTAKPIDAKKLLAVIKRVFPAASQISFATKANRVAFT